MNFIHKNIFLFLIALLFIACSQKQIADLQKYAQKPSVYTKNIKLPDIDQEKESKLFLKNYFSPWDIKKLNFSKEEASWGNAYINKQFYLENNTLAPKKWFEKQIKNSNFENYNKILQKAISTKNANIRVFPTSSRLFYNPKIAGEGFPFDYNQNSLLKINTPLLISHYSKDKAWAYIQSYFVSGWIRVDKLKIVDDTFIKKFKTGDYFIAIKEGFPLSLQKFIEYSKVGTIFPKERDKFLLATQKKLEKIKIKALNVASFPLNLNQNNLSRVAKEFIGELYGWGGIDSHRDCSSFIQDFFSPFGIYLNRNSKAQTKFHEYIDLSSKSDYEKEQFIKNNAIPFLSLVYLKGHIMLYIGNKDDKALVMHNIWGLRTREFPFKKGRNIIGKTVITSLTPGIELNNIDKNRIILKRVQGIVFLNKRVN